MYHNYLVVPILNILRTQEGRLSEYDLIRQIEAKGVTIDVDVAGYQLVLFKKHFMVMNALYTLQSELSAEGVYLQISALSITMTPMTSSDSAGTVLTDHVNVKLSEYYLDWSNYDATGEEDVQRLLTGFWKRYAAIDKQQHALQILGLDADADWNSIREGYRRLARQYHPDK
ncbi:MAG TPA: DNA-J related domain-containing protein, partial [Gammaproteobacteria bacterium]|nr:DNA-J related domain-containing protein [Gammaproteobacteria bacterium]